MIKFVHCNGEVGAETVRDGLIYRIKGSSEAEARELLIALLASKYRPRPRRA